MARTHFNRGVAFLRTVLTQHKLKVREGFPFSDIVRGLSAPCQHYKKGAEEEVCYPCAFHALLGKIEGTRQ